MLIGYDERLDTFYCIEFSLSFAGELGPIYN
jgi:hypothetical protein